MLTCFSCGGESCNHCIGGFVISKRLGLAAGLALIAAVSAGNATAVSQVTFEARPSPATCARASVTSAANCLIDRLTD